MDSHCHLQNEAFDADRDEVIARALDAGIRRILVPGYDRRSSVLALELAARHPNLIDAAVGIHPHHAGAATEEEWLEIERLSTEPAVVAIGEIGLDFHRNLSTPHAQRDALARQLDLAIRRGRPVLIHDREAHEEITGTLLDWAKRSQGPVRGVLHAFSGDRRMALELAGAGFAISFALPVSFSSAREQRMAAASIPGGSLLMETDAPWLGPGPDRRNEPTTVLRVAAELGHLRARTAETIAGEASETYARLTRRQP